MAATPRGGRGDPVVRRDGKGACVDLPGLRARSVVIAEPLQGRGDRRILTFRAETRIDFEKGTRRRRVGEKADHPLGALGGDRRRGFSADRRAERGRRRPLISRGGEQQM